MRSKSSVCFLAVSVVISLFLISISGRPAFCQDAVSHEQVLTIPYLDNPPVIDGNIENTWQKASKISNFFIFKTKQPATNRTEVYLGYDNNNLYLGVILFVNSSYVPIAQSQLNERDKQLWSEDSIELFFPSQTDPDYYYQFIGNRLGSVYDSKDGHAAWNGEWVYKTKIFADRWEAEIAIPFQTIGVVPKENLFLPFQIARDQQIPSELSAWSPVKEMFLEGLKTGGLLLQKGTAVQMDTVSFLKPTVISGKVLSLEKEFTVQVAVTDQKNQVITSQDTKFPNGSFSFSFDDIPYGGHYLAEVNVFLQKGKDTLLLPFEVKPPLTITVNPRILQGNLELILTYFGQDVPDYYRLYFYRTGKDKPIKTMEVKGSMRYKTAFPLADFPIGLYRLKVDSYQNDKIIMSQEVEFEVLAKSAWVGNKIGVSTQVLAPWTPMSVKKNSIFCWGREYRFGSLFPSQIVTQEKEILASPISLEITADDTLQPLQNIPIVVKESKDNKVVLEGTGTSQLLTVKATSTVEYDGMIKVRLDIIPQRELSINNLRLRIPIKKEYAYLRTQTTIWGSTMEEYKELLPGHRMGGAVAEKSWKNKLEPLWLGTEALGLVWFNESDQGFSLEKPDDALEITATGNDTLLTITFINKPLTVTKPLTYVFGLQATPVKPWPEKGYRGYNTVIVPADLWYPGVTNYIYQPVLMDWFKEQNVKAIVDMGEFWSIHDSTLNYKDTWLRDAVKECHKKGIKFFLYLGAGLTTNTPEWKIMSEEALRHPLSTPFSLYTMPELLSYRACPNSVYTDHIAWKIDWVMKEFGLDGVYLDEYGSEQCMNEEHGCGYTDDSGNRHPSKPIFAFREQMKRIYTVVKQNNPNGIVYLHGRQEIPVLSFCDLFLNGEQFIPFESENRPPLLEMVPLSAFKADFMGKPFGIPGTFYVYHGLPWGNSDALAITLLHDTPTIQQALYGPERKQALEETASAWKVMDEFHATNSIFKGYWEQDFLVPAETDVKASFWLSPDKKVLAIIANFGQEKEVQVKFNGVRIGLFGDEVVTAYDPLNKKEVRIEGDTLFITIPKENFRMVLLSPKKR